MSIATMAMVLNLQIGFWAGQRFDREASQKVTAEAGADSDAARVNKHLVDKAALKDVITTSGAIRTHFYLKTLPWKDNGDRLLTREMFQSFIEEHEQLKAKFFEAVDQFLNVEYPAAKAKAEFRMGALFKEEDYPSVQELRRKFYAQLDFDPVSEAGDFRVTLDQEHADEVRATMEKAMQERIGRAMADIWKRIGEVITHFHKTMAVEDKVFRDTTMSNITELLDLLPGLNVLNDPQLVEIGNDIRAKISGVGLDSLRKDKGVRAQAAKDAADIIAKMGGFMNVMAPADDTKLAA